MNIKYIMLPIEDYDDICNATREKTNSQETFLSNEIGSKIRTIKTNLDSNTVEIHSFNTSNPTVQFKNKTNKYYVYGGATNNSSYQITFYRLCGDIYYTSDRTGTSSYPTQMNITIDTNGRIRLPITLQNDQDLIISNQKI